MFDVEFDVAVELDAVGVDGLDELGAVEALPDVLDVVGVVDVEAACDAVCVTPTTRPTVAADAPAATAHAARRERRSMRWGFGCAFIGTTMSRRGSATPHAKVKSVLSGARCWLRGA
jgi:hypothetical protein